MRNDDKLVLEDEVLLEGLQNLLTGMRRSKQAAEVPELLTEEFKSLKHFPIYHYFKGLDQKSQEKLIKFFNKIISRDA